MKEKTQFSSMEIRYSKYTVNRMFRRKAHEIGIEENTMQVRNQTLTA